MNRRQLPLRFLGQPLVLVRDQSGTLRVFHNVCSHRGNELVWEAANVGMRIRCPYHSWAYDLEGKEIRRFQGAEDHFANFVDAIRADDPSVLKAPIIEGHLSSALCHLGNISYLRGKRMDAEAVRAEIGEHPVGKDAFARLAEHLERNEVDLMADHAVLGPYLEFDPETERFRNDPEADRLLTRDYREPFVVPAEV